MTYFFIFETELCLKKSIFFSLPGILFDENIKVSVSFNLKRESSPKAILQFSARGWWAEDLGDARSIWFTGIIFNPTSNRSARRIRKHLASISIRYQSGHQKERQSSMFNGTEWSEISNVIWKAERLFPNTSAPLL